MMTTSQEPADLSDYPEFQALNPKHQKFVLIYLQTGNATQAYISAGYAVKDARNAEACSSRLLSLAKVRAVVNIGKKLNQKEIISKYGITKERIFEELARVAFSNMKRIASWDSGSYQLQDSEQITEEDAACIKSISFAESDGPKGRSQSLSVALHDKVKALHLLSNMKGMLNGESEDPSRKPIDPGVKERLRKLRLKYSGRGNGRGEG